jgi:hypothetical protein
MTAKTVAMRAEHKKRSDKGTATLEQNNALAKQEEDLKKLSKAFASMYETAEKATKEVMDNRFAAFDQCYVRLIELQVCL